jgi:hypothetical protein
MLSCLPSSDAALAELAAAELAEALADEALAEAEDEAALELACDPQLANKLPPAIAAPARPASLIASRLLYERFSIGLFI